VATEDLARVIPPRSVEVSPSAARGHTPVAPPLAGPHR